MPLCVVCDEKEARKGNLKSVLGDGPLCLECLVNRAERPATIHRAAVAGKINPFLSKKLRVWWSHEVGYIKLRDYHRRASKNLPAKPRPVDEPFLDPGHEEEFQTIKKGILNLRRNEEFMASIPLPKTRRRLPWLWGLRWFWGARA